MMTQYIAHFGIPDMRWYHRRFQNEDGSLTEAGRRRYLKGDGSLQKAGEQRRKDAERRSRKLIGSVSLSGGKYAYRTSSQNEKIMSVGADKALKLQNRIEYLDKTLSDPQSGISWKKRYAFTKSLDEAKLEYTVLVKATTKAILDRMKEDRLYDFQNGDFSEYEKRTEEIMRAIGKQRSATAKALGLKL